MDRVPSVFRERVAALWKCCDRLYCNGNCRKMPDCEWTRISRKRRIQFHIGMKKGNWVYGFTALDETAGADRFLTMAELENSPNLKNVVIAGIDVVFDGSIYRLKANLRPLDVDMQVLMKFVTFLSNEPRLQMHSGSAELFDSPEASTLIQWLQKMHYSLIEIESYGTTLNRLLERQFSRSKTPIIKLGWLGNGREFLEAELAALRIKRCSFFADFSTNVVDAIVGRFMEDPSQFGEDYSVQCRFKDDEMKKLLKGYERKNQCNKKKGDTFTFQGPNERILILQIGATNWWHLSANTSM